jgi:hypothetical protein
MKITCNLFRPNIERVRRYILFQRYMINILSLNFIEIIDKIANLSIKNFLKTV